MQLERRLLISGGQLSESLVRTAASRLAELMAGGERGFSWNYGEARGKGYDPEGCFAAVTEGRQCRWKNSSGEWRAYSACEDLHGAVWLRVLGMPPLISDALGAPLDWCNRVEAGKKWRSGWNLRALKQYRDQCWRRYGPRTEWDALPGDAVQIIGRHGGHTLVLLDVSYQDGKPVVCDTAEYGQFHRPKGASRSDHSCLCRYGLPITDGPKGWHIRGRPVYGRGSLWQLAQQVVAELGEVLPAWVPEGFTGGSEADNPETADTDPAPPPVSEPPRDLKHGCEGEDVRRWQKVLLEWDPRALPEWGADGDFGDETEEWTVKWQQAHGLGAGIVDARTRKAAGL